MSHVTHGSSHPILPGLLYRSSAPLTPALPAAPARGPVDWHTPLAILAVAVSGSGWMGGWLIGFGATLCLLWALDLRMAGAARDPGTIGAAGQDASRLLLASLVAFFGLMSLFFWLAVGAAYLSQLNTALMHTRIVVRDQIMWPMLALSGLLILTSARLLRFVMWRYVGGERLFPLLLAFFVPGIIPAVHLAATLYASYFNR